MADTREVEVPLRRLAAWLRTYEQRHGPWTARGGSDPAGWLLAAADGTSALIAAPPWLRHVPGAAPQPDLARLAELSPTFGVLLLRRAGYAVGRFDGRMMAARKVGRRHIQGRTAAGGWSQQRYARRRENAANEIVAATADHAEHVLGGRSLDFLVTGGDRQLVAALLARLTAVTRTAPVAMHLGIGTPDQAVLAQCPDRVLAVSISVPA